MAGRQADVTIIEDDELNRLQQIEASINRKKDEIDVLARQRERILGRLALLEDALAGGQEGDG